MENGLQVVFRFLFSVYGIETDNLYFGGSIKKTKMAALEDVLDRDFVRRFLVEQKHTYEELVSEIKARYPNLKGCSLRSVKRFCSHQGIRKRMPVSDGELDIAVRAAVSEVRMLTSSHH